MQHHFVVFYDDVADKFLVDSQTCFTKFGEEVLFDSNIGNWFELDETFEADYTDYENLLIEKLDGIY